MPDRSADFLAILARHMGAARAIPLLDIAEALGLPRTTHGTRKVQGIKRALCERGTLIGSSCVAGHAGYYLPETIDEMKATLHNYESRFYSLGRLIRSTRRAMAREMSPIEQLEFIL